MSKNPLSIIIPVYKAQDYIAAAIDSILSDNPPENTEIICVADASPDNSVQILERYLSQYKNFKIIINEKNLGPGLSRNKGLKIAKGEYVLFMDADDMINKGSLKYIYNTAIDNDLDILHFSMLLYYQDENRYQKMNKTPDKFLNKVFDINKDIEFLKHSYTINTSTNLYRREFLIKNNIVFTDWRRIEDIFFTIKAITLSSRLMIINKEIILYRQHQASTKYIPYYPDFIFKNYYALQDFFKENGNPEIKKHFLIHGLECIFDDFKRQSRENPKYLLKLYTDIKTFLKNLDLSFISKNELKEQTFYKRYRYFKYTFLPEYLLRYNIYNLYKHLAERNKA